MAEWLGLVGECAVKAFTLLSTELHSPLEHISTGKLEHTSHLHSHSHGIWAEGMFRKLSYPDTAALGKKPCL